MASLVAVVSVVMRSGSEVFPEGILTRPTFRDNVKMANAQLRIGNVEVRQIGLEREFCP